MGLGAGLGVGRGGGGRVGEVREVFLGQPSSPDRGVKGFGKREMSVNRR